jgi:putative ABC transport system permease protein
MTRRTRTGTPGLLARHLASGAGASALVALLIAAAVFAAALAPRALVRLGTDELRHELGQQSPALLDLSASGSIGIVEGMPDPSLDDLVGRTDDEIHDIPQHLPSPLADHLGDALWVAGSTPGIGHLPLPLPMEAVLTLAVDLGWDSRIRFVEGGAPVPWDGSESDGALPDARAPIEVAVSSEAAQQLQLSVGDVIGYSPAPLLVAGVYEPDDPGDAYWVHQHDLAGVTIDRETGKPPKIRATVYMAPLSIAGLTQTMTSGKLTAWIPVDPDGLDYSDVADLQLQVRNLVSSQIGLPSFGSLAFSTGLVDALDRVVERVTAASALLALSASGLLGVLLAVFALGVRSVISRRRPALALASARGAGALQLRAAMVLEGLLVSLPGAALAVTAAAFVLPAEVGPEGWLLPATVALAPPVLFGVLTTPRALRGERGDLRVRSRVRSRWIAEVAVAALAVLSLVLLSRRGLVASSQAVGIDPLLAATPLLLAAAVCVGVLRLYPAPLAGLQRLLRRGRGPVGVLGAARAIRDPALGFAAALSLVVGISIVVFSGVMATTVRSGLEQSAREYVGADLRVDAPQLPGELVERIRQVDGVLAAAPYAVQASVPFSTDGVGGKVFAVVADTAQLHAVRPEIPDLSAEVDGRIPVLVSSDWADRLQNARLAFGGGGAVAAGIIPDDAIPRVTRHFVVVDAVFASALADEVAGAQSVLVRLEPGAASADVAAGVDDLVTSAQPADLRGAVSVTDAVSRLAEARSSPAIGSIETVLAAGALASLLLTMLTVVLASVAAATTRNRLVGVLRILGMSPRQLRAVQAWELAPVALTAVLVGTGLGLVLPFIVTGVLDLRPFVGGRLPPGPAVDPLGVAAAVGAFVVVVLVAGLVASILGRRLAPAGTLKMGEG